MAPRQEMVFLPLGGVGEIGMNLGLYGFGPPRDRKWLMVDCGVSFGSADTHPGIDLVFPDIRFIESERDNLVGIVLTHAHEDHFGALADLWPRLRAKVYATPFTAALLQAKLAEENGAPRIPVEVVDLGATVGIDCFEVEFVTMTHSIPEPNALVIRTDAGTVFHTADWKLDSDPVIGGVTDVARISKIGEEGVDAIVCDSTNVLREGVSPGEGDVGRALRPLIAEAPQRVAVTAFASNVARLKSVALAAAEADRKTVLVGRAMRRAIAVARETGYLDDVPQFLGEEAFGYMPRDKVVLLCTGSQGEPRAALTRIARDDHRQIAFSPGDRLIYSARVIPGNDRPVGAVLNALIRQGIEVITDRTHLVHVSGHPRRGELQQMYQWLKPKAAVPVHGEAMHLHEHAAFARENGIANVVEIYNGDIVRLAPAPAAVVDDVPAGRLVKDGMLVLDEENRALRDRRRLAYAGMVTVSVAVDQDGELAGDPEIAIAGVPGETTEGGPVEAQVLDAVEDLFDKLPRARRRSTDALREALTRAARTTVERAWGKRPLCQVHVIEV
ncbi:MAG: ribonuclease J [Flavobacteriaceae bacterium]